MTIKEKVKEKVLGFFAERAKIWGVDFESHFPSEFVVTIHAEQRIAERVKVKPKKMMKMIVKAWKSQEAVPRLNYLEYEKQYRTSSSSPHLYFRSYMGYVWIFRTKWRRNCSEPQKILITVY